MLEAPLIEVLAKCLLPLNIEAFVKFNVVALKLMMAFIVQFYFSFFFCELMPLGFYYPAQQQV